VSSARTRVLLADWPRFVRDGSVTSTEKVLPALWLLCGYRCARRVFGLLCEFRAAPDWDPAVGGMDATATLRATSAALARLIT